LPILTCARRSEVRLGSDSDLLGHARHVRFTPDSD